ncbi:MAG: condensation domain-containing protein, partial [Candidatus Promineifilaceae bacterium]
MTDDLQEQLLGLTAEERKLLSLLVAEDETLDLPGVIPARSDRSSAYPLSFAQQRMWFLNRLEPQSAAYNIAAAYRLIGPLDIAALEQSLRTLVSRHAALRTVFALRDNVPQQIIREDPQITLTVLDLTHMPPDERESAALEQLTAEGRKPFDLAKELMMRAVLLEVGIDEHILSIVMHHIASDGWSMGVFHRELAELYGAYSRGASPRLAELPIQYTDYVIWQRNWLQGKRLDQQLAYWRKRLAGATPLQLPLDRPRPVIQSYEGDLYSLELPESLLRPLRALSQQAGATLFMTILAAFVTLLHRYSQQEDIVVGTVVANRKQEEVEGLIGFFLNTLALRVDLSGDPAF